MKRTVYRVRKGFPGAGQFAKASSWRRSRAHGGTRYVRQRVEVKRRQKISPPPPPEKVYEYIVTFTYEKTGKSFDLIVTSRTEEAALSFARRFIRRDPNARRIAQSQYHGWTVDIARAHATSAREGKVEYRGESEEEQ